MRKFFRKTIAIACALVLASSLVACEEDEIALGTPGESTRPSEILSASQTAQETATQINSTKAPTAKPTVVPTAAPTAEPTPEPAPEPTEGPLIIDHWDGTMATGFDSGSGTVDNPYVITTAEQLAYFANQVNTGTDYSGKHISLCAEIILNNTNGWELWGTTDASGNIIKPLNSWLPIGNEEHPFKGSFEGNGHNISGIYIYSGEDYQGLFGHVQEGNIKNINILESQIKGYKFVASVAGLLDRSTIDNCSSSAIVRGSYRCSGGLVGSLIKNSVMSNCCNTGVIAGNEKVGGVVGWAYGCDIKYCYNTGNVKKEDEPYYSYRMGGIVGDSCDTAIIWCYNSGDITSADADCVGGIAGYMDGDSGRDSIECCYNSGNIKGRSNVGGIAGACGSTDIVSCYNSGTITASFWMGGILGDSNHANLSCCYNVGTILGLGEGGEIGGVVGSTRVSVRNCYYLNSSVVNPEIVLGTSLTAEQMNLQESYEGFDFASIWTMGGSEDYPYPVFKP